MIKLVLIAALLLLLLFAIKQSVNSLNNSLKGTPVKVRVNASAPYIPNQRIKLEVYYETLCPDSLNFLQHQLEPLFINPLWKERVKLDLIPYGKAHTSKLGISKYKFYCQHGNRECEGNRLHSCAIRYLPTVGSVIHFVTCTMKIMNSAYSASSISEVSLLSCIDAKSVPVAIYKKILSCYKLREGDELLMRHGKKTHGLQPKLTFVPWIVVNEQFRNDVQQRSLHDLKEVLCAFVLAQQSNDIKRKISSPNRNEFARECSVFYRQRRNTNNKDNVTNHNTLKTNTNNKKQKTL